MAWKVYGFMEGHTTGRTTVYGPLPRKRWYPAKGDKKRHVAVSNAFKAAPFDKTDQARKGIEYARWLAARDGKDLPDGSTCAIWADVTLPNGKRQSRVCSVAFGGKICGWKIDIPNWDFVPVEPTHEINDEYFRDLLADLDIAA